MSIARKLQCSCCGGDAGRFVQWWNRDRGFGVCAKCVKWISGSRGFDPEVFARDYGVAGVNYEKPKGD